MFLLVIHVFPLIKVSFAIESEEGFLFVVGIFVVIVVINGVVGVVGVVGGGISSFM